MEMPKIEARWDVKMDRETLRAEIAMRVLLSWEPQPYIDLEGVPVRPEGRTMACCRAVEWADSLLAALESKP